MLAPFVLAGVALAGKGSITELALPTPLALCPGEQAEIEVVAVDAAGRTRPTRRGVTLMWELGPVGRRGAVRMPEDPRAAWGREGRLTARLDADPRVTSETAVSLRYDCAITVDLSGRPGDDGQAGMDGVSTDQGRGGDGQRGQAGDRGAPGPEVHLRVALVPEPRLGKPILQVEIQRPGIGSRFAAIDPDAGELVVVANGGAGGQGGAGGDAGSGGNGGGSGGRPGAGGDGGDGGDGGVVSVFADPSAQGRIRAIVVENGGGPGGVAGWGGDRAGNSAGDAQDARPGRNGRPGADGPPPDVRPAQIGALW